MRRRGIFSYLVCMARVPGPLPLTRDNVEMCGGCLFPTHNHTATRASVAPRSSSATMIRARGGRGGEETTTMINVPSYSFTVATRMTEE